MHPQFGEKLREKLTELKYPRAPWDTVYPLLIQECSSEQIEEIIKAQGVQHLPEIYIQFLQAMGYRAGDMWMGSDITYHALLGLKIDARKLLETDGFTLPEDAFVVLGHQGHTIWFFRTNHHDDEDGCIRDWGQD